MVLILSIADSSLMTQILRFWRKILWFWCDFDVFETVCTKTELRKPFTDCEMLRRPFSKSEIKLWKLQTIKTKLSTSPSHNFPVPWTVKSDYASKLAPKTFIYNFSSTFRLASCSVPENFLWWNVSSTLGSNRPSENWAKLFSGKMIHRLPRARSWGGTQGQCGYRRSIRTWWRNFCENIN